MDKPTDEVDLKEILLLENASPRRKSEHDFPCISSMEKSIMVGKSQVFSKDSTFQNKSEYQKENMLSECSINDCNNLLTFNKQIISFLLDLKKHITYALEKCETKLTVIESSLEKHVTGDTRALICNAGMPYFKDRNHFFAPNNDDEILKENCKELHLRNLPKVAPWTIKERNTLFKAIQEETTVASKKIKRVRLDESTREPLWKPDENMKTRKRLSANDFDELVVPLQEKDVDWFKISSIHFEEVHSPLDCRVMWNVFLHPRINKNSWTKLEDVQLKEITKKYKLQNWDRIAAELNTNRSAYQCFIRCNTIRKLPKVKNCTWKQKEDDKLLKLVKIFQTGDFIPWGEVASWMQNRTKQQVYFRWTYSLAPYLTKGRFSKSEDNLLRDAVAKYGTNFRKISAALMPNRSTVQLHDRYQTLANSQIKNWNVWSLEEDLKLSELFERFGPNWSRIAKAFACKTRTKLRHRHMALQRYINKGVSIRDLHTDYSKDKDNEIKQEKRNEESDGSNRMHCFNRTQPNKDHNEDIDKELIKYFHTEEAIEKSLYHGQQSCTSDKLECNVKKLYSILRQLNAELCIPEDAFNNSMLHDSHRQLLGSLKEYTDKKNNKKRQHMIIDKYSLLMFGANHTYIAESASDNIKFSNRTGCIDYRVNAKSTFLVEKTSVFDTPDVVISHIGGNEQELEFEKLARLLVQSSSSKDKQSVRTTESKGVYAFPSRMPLDQNYSATNSRNNDNRGSLNCSTSCPQSKNTIRNITLFETIREFTSASPAETSKDQYIPAIETTHSTLFSFKRLLGLKPSSNKEHNNPQKFLTMSTRCQRSFNLLETRLEQLFKYPIGLSRTTLPEVYVMDTFSYDDVTSKRKASEPPTIPKPCKTRKCQIFDKSNKDDN